MFSLTNLNYNIKLVQDEYLFKNFIYKYNLTFSISNVQNFKQLLYFMTFNNIECIDFVNTFNKYYFEYFLYGVSILKTLCIGSEFVKDFNSIMITLLKKLHFYDLKKQLNINTWPPLLEELTFKDSWFDRPIEILPPTLKILVLGDFFNQPITNLPPTLEILEFGEFFNQPI